LHGARRQAFDELIAAFGDDLDGCLLYTSISNSMGLLKPIVECRRLAL